MAIEGKGEGKLGRRLRLGMVGGGQGAFIGAVHRIAARLDDRRASAGALSSDPKRARASAAELRIAPERAYPSFEEMATKEAARDDGIDAVAIVTLEPRPSSRQGVPRAGIHVIATSRYHHGRRRARPGRSVRHRSGVRPDPQLHRPPRWCARRARVQAGELGTIRVIQVEYLQDWLTTKLEDTDSRHPRTDPAQSGGGAIGDIGSHAFNLAAFITGLEANPLRRPVDLRRRPPGRRRTNVLRYEAARAACSGPARWRPARDALRVRVYGDQGGERRNVPTSTRLRPATQTITRRPRRYPGGRVQSAASRRSRRGLPRGVRQHLHRRRRADRGQDRGARAC